VIVGGLAASSMKAPIDEGLGAAMVFIVANVVLIPAVPLIGLISGRGGIAVGWFVPPVVIYMLSARFVALDVAQIQPALSRDLTPPVHQHRLVVLDYALPECDPTCLELLARSDYAVALRRDDGSTWSVFRKLQGDACRTTAEVDQISFIRLGYIGICATETPQRQIDDALIIRWTRYEQGRRSDSLPSSFSGISYELIERTAGKDTLLGRWIEGRIHSRFDWMLTFFEADPVEVGAFSKHREFHSAALGISFSKSYPPGNADSAALLDALEPLLGEGESGREARDLYAEIAGRQSDSSIAVVLTRTHRFLRSANPALVEAGVSIVRSLQAYRAESLKTDVAYVLKTGDPKIVSVALPALFVFDRSDPEFVERQLVDLVFSPTLRDTEAESLAKLVSHLKWRKAPFPQDIRARTKTLFLSDPNLSRGQRRALLAILALGGRSESQEAADAVFAMSGSAFVTSVTAVSNRENWSILHDSHWSDRDLERLVERTSEIPVGQLVAYVDTFRFQDTFVPMRTNLSDVIDARLKTMEASADPDPKELSILKRLIAELS
jgi:hypothetical protein